MVRAAAYRTRKYAAKMDPDSIKQRFADHRDTMIEQEEAIFGQLELIEEKAKSVCEAAGIASISIPGYLNFARQCWKYFKKFSQATRTNEVTGLFNLWVSRGLTASILADIAALCGVTIPGY